MDYSKLPKLSQTPAPPPEPPVESAPSQVPVLASRVEPQPGLGAEVWLSAIIGLVMIMMAWNFARFLGATLTGQMFHTNVTWQTEERAGEEVAYFDLEGYTAWSESAMFLFGVALLLEAAALAAAHRPFAARKLLVGFALTITVIATIYNLGVAGLLFTHGMMPIISILIVAFGGYMAAYEWRLLKSLNATSRSNHAT